MIGFGLGMSLDTYERYYEESYNSAPVCVECGEHIQDDYCYEISGDIYCLDCGRDKLDEMFRTETRYVSDEC